MWATKCVEIEVAILVLLTILCAGVPVMELNGKETWINSDRRYCVFDLGRFAQYSQNPPEQLQTCFVLQILARNQNNKEEKL